tara:strand:+ start:938 stop:1369 length:432 start_codon:yes stop_codon:yes gene_type:complete
MKNFKDVWEDAAANSVAGGGVSLPADAVKPKRKKSVYDGRTKEGRKFVERMVARKRSRKDAEEKKLYAQNMKSVSVKEESIEEKAPKIKGLSMYGSEINGLKQGMKTFSAKPVISKGKLAYRVVDEFGGFETLNLKAFAKKFG